MKGWHPTDSPLVQECRKGVMEFLDQSPAGLSDLRSAGECRLQEFSVEYGRGHSRFLEHKVKKPKMSSGTARHASTRGALHSVFALYLVLCRRYE